MNSFGKILVVFVTAASLGFVAFTLSLVSGGPNWKAEMQSDELTNDFVFTTTNTEKGPNYSVKARRTDAAVGGQTPVISEVVVKARDKQVKDAKEEETRLQTEINRLKPILEEVKALIPPDKAGMAARAQLLDKILTKISGDIHTTTQEIATKASAIQLIQKTTQERREEAFRLKNQLELLRTDLFVEQAQQKILEDELVRVEENERRLARRNDQLKKQVEPYEK